MTTQVHTENLVVPKQYLIPNWPVRYVAVSMDGKKIAVSGRNGFVHYNSISHRWYSFGNVKQENSLHIVGGIAWWKQYICLSCISEDHGKSEVRVYPSERKLDDQFSSVCELGSLAQPVIVDNFQNWFLVLTNDGHLRSFGLAECVSNTVRISPFKEVDLSDIVIFPTCVLRICLSSLKSNTSIAVNYQSDAATTDPFSNSDPNYCTAESLLINYSGDLFLLQRLSSKVTHQNYSKKSSESNKQQLFFDKPLLVASKTEIVWSASCLQPAQSPQLDGFYLTSPDVHHINSYTKNSLWLYSGASGLSVWLLLPRITSSPFDINCESVALYSNKRFWVDHESSSTVSCRRIMLSFDLSDNFYPLSIFFQEELLVGIHNDFHFCWNKSTRGAGKSSFADIFTLFQYATLTVKVQIAHHQIIRQLLKRNLGNHASQMSLAYQNLTYFPIFWNYYCMKCWRLKLHPKF
ncbi:unnamed protein product [Heterobilharzia americana]|nr:unnamed protein product [Heterobilharzia americana]